MDGEKIYKALFATTELTELSSQRIELRNIKEVVEATRRLKGLEKELMKEAEKYMDALNKFEKAYADANGIRNEANRAAGDAIRIKDDFGKLIKSVGLSPTDSREYRDLEEMIKQTFDNQKDFDANITKP